MKDKGEEFVSSGYQGKKSNIDYEAIRQKISADLEDWKTYKNKKEFDWKKFDILKKNNGFVAVFKGFGDAVIDSSGKKEDVEQCLSYIKEIISHYAYYLKDFECSDIVQVTLTFLENLNDYILDNHNLLEIWTNILNILVANRIMAYKDIEKLSGLNDEQFKCVAEVICKSLLLFSNDNSKEYENEITNTTLYKVNRKYFNGYLK